MILRINDFGQDKSTLLYRTCPNVWSRRVAKVLGCGKWPFVSIPTIQTLRATQRTVSIPTTSPSMPLYELLLRFQVGASFQLVSVKETFPQKAVAPKLHNRNFKILTGHRPLSSQSVGGCESKWPFVSIPSYPNAKSNSTNYCFDSHYPTGDIPHQTAPYCLADERFATFPKTRYI